MAGRAATATSPPALPPPGGEQFAEVVVVRHGETSWNASRTIQGQMDPELNETGRRQALVVARRLSREARPAAVYSSDLKRAAETAQTIATACGVSSLVLDPALRERHMGDLHGLVFDDAVRRSPEIFSSYSRTQEIPGGGESLDQLSERCVSYLNTVAEKHKGDRVIVVTHGASTEELCIHADPTSPVRGKLYNTSICVFRIGGGEWILDKAGDVGHLDQGEFLEDAFGGDGASA
ncbi:putative phosphoglycerate mutase gpmB [Hordeum vulgare]|nr:putative phosphoglycerate mutase gpmB [Hordeum vulgare]